MLRADNIHETTVEIAGKGGFTGDPAQNFFLERYANAYRLELAAFIDAVHGRQDAVALAATTACMAQRLADAATEARETGKPVKIKLGF